MNAKVHSETSGFENIGKFYKHIRSKNNLTNNHRSLYMLLVEYCFGYTNNIKYEIQISNKQISSELGMSKNTISKILSELEKHALIKRIKWQDYGPKQSYKYSIVFPKEYYISHKQKQSSEDEQSQKIIQHKNHTDKLLEGKQ